MRLCSSSSSRDTRKSLAEALVLDVDGISGLACGILELDQQILVCDVDCVSNQEIGLAKRCT